MDIVLQSNNKLLESVEITLMYLFHFWNWFWFYRRGKIKYKVFLFGQTYMATASNGEVTVVNCYGKSKQEAINRAKIRLDKTLSTKE